MIDKNYALITVFVIALITFLLRLVPFIFFPSGKKVPEFIDYIGKMFPYSIIGMLVIYCFQSIKITEAPYGAPEIMAGLLVVVLHVLKRNTLLSIGVGTFVYMFWVQSLFS